MIKLIPKLSGQWSILYHLILRLLKEACTRNVVLPCGSCVHVCTRHSLWCRSVRPGYNSLIQNRILVNNNLYKVLFDSFPIISKKVTSCWIFFMITTKPVTGDLVLRLCHSAKKLCWPVFHTQVIEILFHLQTNTAVIFSNYQLVCHGSWCPTYEN